MGDNHHHGAAGAASNKLALCFGITVVFLVAQVAVGFSSGSIAVLSDAGDVANDAIGLGMAWAAVTTAKRRVDGGTRTFGLYRVEILVSLVNALALFGIAALVIYEAVGRLSDPPEVSGWPLIIVGAAGLAVNFVVVVTLRNTARTALVVKSAYLDALADMLGGVALIIGGTLALTTPIDWLDPVLAIALGLWIIPRAVGLAREALRILLQAAPTHLSIPELRNALTSIDGVVDVHDLHVWTLTSEMDVLTAHLVVGEGTDHHSTLDAARELLHRDFGLDHATLQVEPDSHKGCDEVAW